MDDIEIKILGHCEECGSRILAADEFPYSAECYYSEETGVFFDSIECILSYYGIQKIEV